MSDSSSVFEYNHCKRKPPSPSNLRKSILPTKPNHIMNSQSGPDDEKDLVLTNRPVTLVDYDDDDEEDDVEIIEIIEVPRPLPKKTAPPAPALSKILKKEREEQEVEEKRLKKQHNVIDIRKKIPPPPPALSHYLEKERAQEEKMLKFKKFLSEEFPHRSKLSLDEEERLRNLYPNKMYLDQYEKFSSKFNEDVTSKNRYRNTNRKDKTRTRNETYSESTSKGSGDSTDEDSKSNTTTTITTSTTTTTTTNDNSVKMVVPNPKFYSENKTRNPPISVKTVATTHSTSRKQSGPGTRNQFKEDYDFLLNGIPNDLQYRIFEYATPKSNNPRLMANQNPAAEGFLFLKEKKDASQIHAYDNKGSTSLSSSRYFDGLSHIDKDKDKDYVIPTSIPNHKSNLTMGKNSSFDSGNGNSNEAIVSSVRKRPSSPSILDVSAQTVDRYLPFISSTHALPALSNSKEITPSTIIEKPPTPSPPVEKNVDELQTANIITICLD